MIDIEILCSVLYIYTDVLLPFAKLYWDLFRQDLGTLVTKDTQYKGGYHRHYNGGNL